MHIHAFTFVCSQVCVQQQCTVAVGGKGPEYQNVTVCAQVVWLECEELTTHSVSVQFNNQNGYISNTGGHPYTYTLIC